MQTDRYFYISTLPALGELGSAPPMGLADLIEHVEEREKWAKLLGALIMMDDLKQREAFLAGELADVEPAVLTVQQARGEAALPEELNPPEDDVDREEMLGQVTIEADRLWIDYFHYAASVARARRSHFLRRWIAHEVALRNAVAAARAKRLGLEEAGYLVATDLADTDEDLSDVITEWESAGTPLAGLRVLIRARWEWINRNESWFSFSVDEMLVYAARVMLMEQWRRTADGTESAA